MGRIRLVWDFAAFAARPTIVRSVLFSIAIMGEAAKSISPGFKARGTSDQEAVVLASISAGAGPKIVDGG